MRKAIIDHNKNQICPCNHAKDMPISLIVMRHTNMTQHVISVIHNALLQYKIGKWMKNIVPIIDEENIHANVNNNYVTMGSGETSFCLAVPNTRFLMMMIALGH